MAASNLALLGVGSGASSAFTPASIAGLSAWYKADAGTSTTTDGAADSQWDDQSGNANHLSQATGAKQPVYKAAIQNGLPVLRHDNTDDGLFNSLAVPTTFSLFCVYSTNSTTGFHRAVQARAANWLIGPYNGNHQLYAGGFASPVGPAVVAGAFAGRYFATP